MKNLIVVLALVCLFVPGTINSFQSNEPTLVPFKVNVEESVMDQIAQKFEVTLKHKDGYEVLVPMDQMDEFTALAPDAKMIFQKPAIKLRKFDITGSAVKDLRQYRLFHQILEAVKNLEAQNPDLVQYVEYGRSADDRPLFALKISDNVTVDEDEPELMITAATHGDEIITPEVVLDLINKMVDGYNGGDQRFLDMVNNREIYFIPVVNPDGFVNRARYDKGIDPNRSYPWPGKPDALGSPSIAPLMKFFGERNFVGSLDFHAYGELTMYPWAYTRDSVPKEHKAVYDTLAKKMASTNGYTYGQISKVIYVAVGSSADYYYWSKGTIAMAIEMGSEKNPHPSEIEAYTQAQTESTWLFIENF